MPLSCLVKPQTDSLFYATHNNYRILWLNDLNFMPENHTLFSSPLRRTNDFYPEACTSLSIAINIPPNGYVWSNCAVILEHPSGKGFTHWSETVVAVTSPQLQASISLFQYLAAWSDFSMHSDIAPWAARERWEILMSTLQEPHCHGMRRECIDALKSVQLLLSQP